MRNKNKKVVVENLAITDYAAEGKSIGRLEGKVIFVENAVPGDVVDVLLMKNKADWAEGVVVNIRTYSPERVQAFCEHFGYCGGCRWQMLPYERQLFYKEQQAVQQFRHIAKIDQFELLPIVGADQNTHYRNKLEYTFANKRYIPRAELEAAEGDFSIFDREPAAAAGFHAKRIYDKVVDIHQCHLQVEPTNGIRLWLKQYAIDQGWSFYDAKEHTGFMRNVMLRICTTGEIMVNVVVGEDDPERIDGMLRGLLAAFPQITTLLYTVNTKWNDSLQNLEPQVFHGKGYVVEKLEEFSFKISPRSFFQTNTRQAEKLYQITRQFAGLTGTETVYDLYCGTGSIGIFVSEKAQKIIGVEVVGDAIVDAWENAALNGVEHAHFFTGDVIDVCTDEFFAQHGRPDVVITDPPRAGMHEALVQKLLDMAAPTIVYVSCNVATQARDIALLAEKYRVQKVQPVDMFPHTHHIECVALLKLK
jgi:23S rRNA (uracil1939-C5)-methyltransferase